MNYQISVSLLEKDKEISIPIMGHLLLGYFCNGRTVVICNKTVTWVATDMADACGKETDFSIN